MGEKTDFSLTPEADKERRQIIEQNAFIDRFVMNNRYGSYSEARRAWSRRLNYLTEMEAQGIDPATYVQQHPELVDDFQKLELI